MKAVVESYLERDKNLNEETSRHWGEIADRTYLFDRGVRQATAVGALSLDDLLGFYDRHFAADGPGRRKVSAWVHGNQHPVGGGGAGGGEKDGAVDTASAAEEGGEERSGGTGGEEESAGEGASGEDSDGGGGGGGGSVGIARKVVVVGDYDEFKRSMPLLPAPKPSRAAAAAVQQGVEQSKL